MGGGDFSKAFYDEVQQKHASTGTDPFAYTSSVRAGTVAAKCHELMDPKGVKFREARDNPDHPETVPVVIGLDVTGSMTTSSFTSPARGRATRSRSSTGGRRVAARARSSTAITRHDNFS